MNKDISIIGDALHTLILDSFNEGITQQKVTSDQLVKKVNSTTSQNAYTWFSHIPGFKEWFENQPRVYRNIETNNFSIKNRRFEETIKVSMDTYNDEESGSYGNLANLMGANGALLQDELVYELFNGGFTTTKAFDGKTWFASDHKVGLSTYNNTSSAALSAAAYENAVATISNYKVKADKLSKERPLNPVPELTLLVPPSLRATAEKILEAQEVDGSSNVNFHSAKLVVCPWISSNTAWFLIVTGGPMKPVYVQEREKLYLKQLSAESSYSVEQDAFVFYGKCRIAALPTFPWLVWGSTGA